MALDLDLDDGAQECNSLLQWQSTLSSFERRPIYFEDMATNLTRALLDKAEFIGNGEECRRGFKTTSLRRNALLISAAGDSGRRRDPRTRRKKVSRIDLASVQYSSRLTTQDKGFQPTPELPTPTMEDLAKEGLLDKNGQVPEWIRCVG